jgi:putative redox protein
MSDNKIETSWVSGDRYTVDIRGHRFFVDQPVEFGGEDSAPTPVELFVASLTACVAHYGGRFLARHGYGRAGLHVVTEYETTTSPARVNEIRLQVYPPGEMPHDLRPALLAVVSHCTVHNTIQLGPLVSIDIA